MIIRLYYIIVLTQNYIVCEINETKWHFDLHIARRTGKRWGIKVFQWRPLTKQRSNGRPPLSMDQGRKDDGGKVAASQWMEVACDLKEWHSMWEIYI